MGDEVEKTRYPASLASWTALAPTEDAPPVTKIMGEEEVVGVVFVEVGRGSCRSTKRPITFSTLKSW